MWTSSSLRTVGGAIAAALVAVACRGSAVQATGPCGATTPAPATYDHIIWVWMENHTSEQVLGTRDAPYENMLARQCAHATDYSSVGAPSLPNYLGATSGDTWGIADDRPPSDHALTADNIFRQVRAGGRRALSYEEAMPEPCALQGVATYAVKHNPAAYYQGADDREACQRDDLPIVSSTQPSFAAALGDGTLPAFSFVTPDLCHDTHDCAVRVGDEWLKDFLEPIFTSATYRQGRTAVFVVWDEDIPMPFLAIAPSVAVGTVVTAHVDHYALLRTTEEMLGLSTFLGHAAAAPSMRKALRV